MPKQTYLVLVIIIFTFIFENSIAQIKDVDGWYKAKWGMTEEEIIKTFGKEVKKISTKYIIDPTIYEPLAIPGFKIENEVYEVYFAFDSESNKLVRVSLEPTGVSDLMPLLTFEKLDKSLKSKYGNPSHQRDCDEKGFYVRYGEEVSEEKIICSDRKYTRQWFYPSTVIMLYYDEIFGRAILKLTYTSTQKRPFNVYDEVPKQKTKDEEKL